MYSGRVDLNIQLTIFDENGNLYRTITINPETNKPFTSVEEANEYLQKLLNELNAEYMKKIDIKLVDSNGNTITQAVAGTQGKLIVESNFPIQSDTLVVPIVDKVNDRKFLISVRKVSDTKFESSEFPLEAGIFNIDETTFSSVNNLDNDTQVSATDAIITNI